jgi:hypothetical protein
MERCEACNAAMPADHGFATMCERCDSGGELEIVGEVAPAKPFVMPVPPVAPKRTRRVTAIDIAKAAPVVTQHYIEIELDEATMDELQAEKLRLERLVTQVKQDMALHEHQ